MKFIASAVVILLSLSAPIADARREPRSVTSIPRGGATKQSVAFHKDARVWGGDATAKQIRGGEGGGTSTMTSHLFNMVKAIVGVGVLSLPAGKFVLGLLCVSYLKGVKSNTDRR